MSVAVAQTKSDQSGVYEREDLLNGCQAVAHGVRLADVDVIAAYPIRPYTEVMDALSKTDRRRSIRLRVHHRRQRALAVRDRQARQLGKRARLRRVAAAQAGCTAWKRSSSPRPTVCRRSSWWATARWTIRAPSASSTTTQWRSATWAGCLLGDTAQEALEHVLIGYRMAEDNGADADGTRDGRRIPDPLAAHGEGAVARGGRRSSCRPSTSASARLHPDNPISIAPQVNEDWVMETAPPELGSRATRRAVIKEAYKEFNKIFGER